MTYQEIIKLLKKESEANYKSFTENLIKDKKEILGVRIPKLKQISKQVNLNEYLKEYKGIYFEEIMLYGISLNNLTDKKDIIKYIKKYKKEITNWSLCDTPASNLKQIKKDKKYYYEEIINLTKSDEEFEIRFGITLLLFHYIDDEYINDILNIVTSIKNTKYYVEMAKAWFLCECYIKYKKETEKYLNINTLNKFTLNKTISKINDSYRVIIEDKKMLKKRVVK